MLTDTHYHLCMDEAIAKAKQDSYYYNSAISHIMNAIYEDITLSNNFELCLIANDFTHFFDSEFYAMLYDSPDEILHAFNISDMLHFIDFIQDEMLIIVSRIERQKRKAKIRSKIRPYSS